MSNKNELKIKLKELEANLENNNVQKELESNQFNIDDLKQTIQFYYKNIEQINDEDLKNILTKVNELVSHSNNSAFSVYSHKFINTARYLINNLPEVEPDIDDNFSIQNNTQISEEEFLNRCEKLIEQLGYEHEEPKLILKTQVDKKEFRVFKNKNKSIIYFAENSTNGMSTSLENLKEIAFKRKESNRKSYDSVIISKILDNTIFNEINKTFDAQLNESLINQIRKHSEELFKLKNDFEVIQKDKEDFNTAKTELSEILSKSTTAQLEFKNAKEAAVNYAKLNASVSYWETKQKNHKEQFDKYQKIAIYLICGLVLILGVFIYFEKQSNDKSSKTEPKKEMPEKQVKNDEINQLNEKKDIKSELKELKVEKQGKDNKSLAIDINVQIEKVRQTYKEELDEESRKISEKKDENSLLKDFENSNLPWYFLMIFTTSSAFWIIRITVKIALSNLHLSEDAYERVVMIQTYLSFVKEGQIEKNDKNLILSSLFRTSNIGIIQDESSVTVSDIITTFKK